MLYTFSVEETEKGKAAFERFIAIRPLWTIRKWEDLPEADRVHWVLTCKYRMQ